MVRFETVHYLCPNCNSNAKVSGVRPLTCNVCNKLICKKCSSHAICSECYKLIPVDVKKILNSARRSAYWWMFGSVGFVFISAAIGLILGKIYANEQVNQIDSAIDILKNPAVWIVGGFFQMCFTTPIGMIKMKSYNKKARYAKNYINHNQEVNKSSTSFLNNLTP